MELEAAYRGCKDAKEKTRRQGIWLYVQHPNNEAIAQAVGFSRNWVYKVVRCYNQEGLAGLADRHQVNPRGNRPILNEAEQRALW